MAARIRRRVGKPTAAVMRRTWRLRPSRMPSSIHAVRMALRTRTAGSRSYRPGGASIRPTLAGRVAKSLRCTPPPQRRQRRIVRLAFYLPPIGLEQIEARVTDARLQLAAKSQQKNSSSNANSGRRSKSASRWCVSLMA